MSRITKREAKAIVKRREEVLAEIDRLQAELKELKFEETEVTTRKAKVKFEYLTITVSGEIPMEVDIIDSGDYDPLLENKQSVEDSVYDTLVGKGKTMTLGGVKCRIEDVFCEQFDVVLSNGKVIEV